MAGSTKLMTASGGGVVLTPASSIASDVTVNVPSVDGTLVSTGETGQVSQAMLASGVAGNGPAFSAYASTNQTLSSNVFTKILFDTEVFDTNNNFASSRFTPTVAGYYFISSGVGVGASTTGANMTLYKNGSAYQEMVALSASMNTVCGNTPLVYLNGTTDYVEIYVRFVTGQNTFGNSQYTYFSGAMVRAA